MQHLEQSQPPQNRFLIVISSFTVAALISLGIIIVVREFARHRKIGREATEAYDAGRTAGLDPLSRGLPPDLQSGRARQAWDAGFEAGRIKLREQLRIREEQAILAAGELARKQLEELRQREVEEAQAEQLRLGLETLDRVRATYSRSIELIKQSKIDFSHRDAYEFAKFARENRHSSDFATMKFIVAWMIKIDRDTANAEFERVLSTSQEPHGISSGTEWYAIKQVMTGGSNLDDESELKPFMMKYHLDKESILEWQKTRVPGR